MTAPVPVPAVPDLHLDVLLRIASATEAIATQLETANMLAFNTTPKTRDMAPIADRMDMEMPT